jgi:hypothetical protein
MGEKTHAISISKMRSDALDITKEFYLFVDSTRVLLNVNALQKKKRFCWSELLQSQAEKCIAMVTCQLGWPCGHPFDTFYNNLQMHEVLALSRP